MNEKLRKQAQHIEALAAEKEDVLAKFQVSLSPRVLSQSPDHECNRMQHLISKITLTLAHVALYPWIRCIAVTCIDDAVECRDCP